jgi:histone-binding protein RBBP4
MPQNHFIVASRGPSSDLYIWDVSKHPSFPTEQSYFSPQATCAGHEKEGYAMSWSKHSAGKLLSGSEDATVRLWDINVAMSSSAWKGNNISDSVRIRPLITLSQNGHTDTVEDVDWHPVDHELVISVGDDKRICLWDIRDGTKPTHNLSENTHTSDINCVAFNPVNVNLFATGSADTTIGIWDIRNLSKKLCTLQNHNDQVFKVEWAPFNESILGSCSADRRVTLWDLSRIGQEQSQEDAEDGPPELLFVHGGHTSKVSDFSWNANDQWTIASVSEDNVLQVWNIAEEIYAADDNNNNDDDDDDDDEINNDGTATTNKSNATGSHDEDDNVANDKTTDDADGSATSANANAEASTSQSLAMLTGAGEDGMLGEDELED